MEVGPFVRQYRAAVRADFYHEYGRGLRGLRPSEVYDLILKLPPTSHLARELNPDYAWPPPEVFLSRIEYELHVLLWSHTKDAKYQRNVPEQILPAGLKEQARKPRKLREDLEPLTIEELDKKLSTKRVPV